MIKKYNYIELLRFVSAFSVLMAHYMHFFNPFNGFSEIEIFSGYLEFNKEFLPFYSVIENFYKFGHMGVYFFWELSGFVLAYAYLNTLRYKIKFKEFFVNRFARLYPLHLITLIILIFLQFLLIKNFGQQQITDNSFYSGINNLKNFFYHIFLSLVGSMKAK